MKTFILKDADISLLKCLLEQGETYAYHLATLLPSWPRSSLYARLTYLQKQNLLSNRLVRSAKNPSRRVYSLTRQGKARLNQEITILLTQQTDHLLQERQRYVISLAFVNHLRHLWFQLNR